MARAPELKSITREQVPAHVMEAFRGHDRMHWFKAGVWVFGTWEGGLIDYEWRRDACGGWSVKTTPFLEQGEEEELIWYRTSISLPIRIPRVLQGACELAAAPPPKRAAVPTLASLRGIASLPAGVTSEQAVENARSSWGDRAAVPLTEEQIEEIGLRNGWVKYWFEPPNVLGEFARAIEAAHNIVPQRAGAKVGSTAQGSEHPSGSPVEGVRTEPVGGGEG